MLETSRSVPGPHLALYPYGGRKLYCGRMFKRLVYWIIFLAVVLHVFAGLAALLGDPAFLPALPR